MSIRGLNSTVRLVNPDGTATREFYLFLQAALAAQKLSISEDDLLLSGDFGGNDFAIAQSVRAADELGTGSDPQISTLLAQVAQLTRDLDDLRKGGIVL